MDIADLDDRDRAVLNAFQGGFPVVQRPFEPAAHALRSRGIESEPADLLERVQRLDEEGVLTRFGALINAEEIGGNASLVAMHAPRTATRRSPSSSTNAARSRTTTSANTRT